MKRLAWIAAALPLIAGAARAAPVSASLTVSGQVGAPGAYDAAALRALPAVSETETYRAAGVPVADTFTGATLWSLIQAAGGAAADPSVKNGLLRGYVVATGGDGYQAAISLGEISPKFGAKPDLIAYADTGGRLPAPDGFARVVADGDLGGGRYVSNVTDLRVGVAPAQPGIGGGPASSLTVGGAVARKLTDDASALRALAPRTETVTYLAGGTPVTDTYTGALLWDVLNAAGVLTDPAVKNDILRKIVTVAGSDGYQADLSLGEIDPLFGDEQVLVAYADTDGQLGAGGDGFARLVVPGDVAGGRYVSNLSSLTVFDATVPEPPGPALLLAGAAALGVARRAARPSGH